MKDYNKLVRNRIPEIITAENKKPITHVASKQEFEEALIDKLKEEVGEYQVSREIEELADIVEVVEAIGVSKGLSMRQLNKIRHKKSSERGSFSKKIILDRVE